MPHRLLACLAAFAIVLVPLPLSAQGRGAGRTAPTEQATPPAANPSATDGAAVTADAVTRHSIEVGGKPLAYTATAGSLPLRDGEGKHLGDMFYVAYVQEGGQEGGAAAERPITFAFNGGPGAASAYLQLGAMGPRVIVFPPGGGMPASAVKLADNPDTWLPFTDLVFVDPIGTGFSRGVGSQGDIAKNFWGVRQDVNAMAAFIRLYLTRNGRMLSPKFLVGESYGGFRAARLAKQLRNERGIALFGIVMVSPALEFSLTWANPYDPLPWSFLLAAYSATRLAVETGDPPSSASLAETERFALGDYLTGIVSGPKDPAAADRLYRETARLTGLPVETVAHYRGRVPVDAFIRAAAPGEGKIASRYDATVAGLDPYPESARPRGADPILTASIAPFTTAFTAYARDELNYRSEQSYGLLEGEVSGHWQWREGERGQGYAGSMEALHEARAADPALKVMIAHGVSDMVTPYLASRYLIDAMPPLADARPIDLKLYRGGHMMYTRPDARAALAADAKALYEPAPPR